MTDIFTTVLKQSEVLTLDETEKLAKRLLLTAYVNGADVLGVIDMWNYLRVMFKGCR